MIYTAVLTREGRDWIATVANLDGVNTWATSLSQLDAHVREAIALAEDLPEGEEDSLVVEWAVPDATHSNVTTD